MLNIAGPSAYLVKGREFSIVTFNLICSITVIIDTAYYCI